MPDGTTPVKTFPLWRWVVLAMAVCVLVPVETAWAADQKRVLVVYSTRRDAQIVVVGDRDLPRILERNLTQGVDYYSEFIDQARFASGEYRNAFRDFLRLKYSDHRFDLLIAMGDTAIEFLDASRTELFPDTPIVFFSNGVLSPRLPNSTGVVAELNFAGTVALAMELQPDTRQVFVVGDADRAYEEIARAQLTRFEPKLAVTYLSGLPTKDLEDRLASLPDHSIVYYTYVGRDGANQNYNPLEYLDRVVAAARVPTYCWVDSAMDHGIVGGSLKSQSAQTEAIGNLAVRVLRGERADSIPVTSSDFNVAQVDWRQLRRWRIREAAVPAGVHVLFREPGVWDRYRRYIVGAMVLMLAQALLIAGLLVQAARRRTAEAKLRARDASLRASYARILALGGRLLNAQEAERARIARELHDDACQQMTVLVLDLEGMAHLGDDREKTADVAASALTRAQHVIKSLRALSHRLHPANLRFVGLVPALDGLQRELSTADTSVTFSHENVPARLSQDLMLCVFRVAQEALQNAVKHSGAREVAMHLTGAGETLTLVVEDNGFGFDVQAAHGGLGLISIGERVEQAGGTLNVRSAPGAGTRVEVTVPVSARVQGVAV
jgi:signal transduction histidine kinase